MGKNIAILASGNGSNAENLIRYFQHSQVAEVKLVLSNRKQAFVLERAGSLGVECHYLAKDEWISGVKVLELLKRAAIDFIVLAGFLACIPDPILHAYPGRIINIHPSLLPKFGGKGMYGDHVHAAVLAAGEQESGITIHYINEHYDEGEIIAQYHCPVCPTDTPAALAARVHALEYEYYPKVIEQLLLV